MAVDDDEIDDKQRQHDEHHAQGIDVGVHPGREELTVATAELDKPVVESEHSLSKTERYRGPEQPERGMEEPLGTAGLGPVEQLQTEDEQQQDESDRRYTERTVDEHLGRTGTGQTEHVAYVAAMTAGVAAGEHRVVGTTGEEKTNIGHGQEDSQGHHDTTHHVVGAFVLDKLREARPKRLLLHADGVGLSICIRSCMICASGHNNSNLAAKVQHFFEIGK